MASILLNLDKSPSSDTVLAVDALGFVNEKWPKQIIEVWVNAKQVGKVTNSLVSPAGQRSVLVSKDLLMDHEGPVDIQFRFENSISPARLGTSSVSRELALGLKSLTLRLAGGKSVSPENN
jgi:hypothetical protein